VVRNAVAPAAAMPAAIMRERHRLIIVAPSERVALPVWGDRFALFVGTT
jgi:hypothetical protein